MLLYRGISCQHLTKQEMILHYLVSVIVEAPTVIASGTLAGEAEHASILSLPAATTYLQRKTT
jgi:hypothetical protein